MSAATASATSSGSSSKAPAKAPDPPLAFLTKGGIPRFRCDQKHPITGLYVLFRMSSGKCAHDDLEKFLDDLEDDETRKKQELARTVFTLGIVNLFGVLQPVKDDANPWYEIGLTGDRSLDAFKFIAGEEYELYFLRHPSPKVARGFRDFLNEKDKVDCQFKDQFPDWKDKKAQKLKVTDDNGTFYFDLKEDASWYVPEGPGRYDKWLLYREMPHTLCLQSQLEKFANDLGELRYPSGSANSPFEAYKVDVDTRDTPTKKTKSTAVFFDAQLQAALGGFQMHLGTREVFVLSHPEAARGQPKGNGDAAHRAAWAFTLGDAKAGGCDCPACAGDPVAPDLGVVDQKTADCIEHWLNNNYRKPGEVLVPIDGGSRWGNWMLERGAIAFDAWCELAAAFGCDYGIKDGSSFRYLADPGGGGAIRNSIHKTGLAIDLDCSDNDDYHLSNARFPIRYEASWTALDLAKRDVYKAAAKQLSAAQAKVKADEAKIVAAEADYNKPGGQTTKNRDAITSARVQYNSSVQEVEAANKRVDRAQTSLEQARLDHKQTWRLYAHSTLNVVGHGKTTREDKLRLATSELQKLKASLATYLASFEYADSLRVKLLNRYFVPALQGAADGRKYLDGKLKAEYGRFDGFSGKIDSIDAAVSKLANAEPHCLRNLFFRSMVFQWLADPLSVIGGKPCEKGHLPHDAAKKDDFPPHKKPGDQKSWVNIAALAWVCGLKRISPHEFSVRDMSWTVAADKPVGMPMLRYFREGDGRRDPDLVATILDAASEKKIVRQIQVLESIGSERMKVGRQFNAKDVDLDLLTGWRRELGALYETVYGSKYQDDRKSGSVKVGTLRLPMDETGGSSPAGAEVAIVFCASPEESGFPGDQQAINGFLDKLRGSFANSGFTLVGAGKLTGLNPGSYMGAGLADVIKSALDRFQKSATSGSDDTFSCTRCDRVMTEIKDLTVTIQPIFCQTAGADVFLPRQTLNIPGHLWAKELEWWHYQHRSVARWGAPVERCGYAKDVVVSFPGVDPDAKNPPPPDPDGKPVPLGLGYYDKDWDGLVGGVDDEAMAENWDELLKEGSRVPDPPTFFDGHRCDPAVCPEPAKTQPAKCTATECEGEQD